ncbi:MAG: LysR family transcriptional regulator [Lachnospiraceae bacterium]|nr:LysR family transcriptional regulator [Lachnospiraceae bacterium]
MNYRLSIRLVDEQGEKFFGEGVAALLEHIDQEGSMNLAAKKMDLAYSKAWKILHRAEETLGYDLIIKRTGGSHGGGSTLTEEGRVFLGKYRRFEKKLRQNAEELFHESF